MQIINNKTNYVIIITLMHLSKSVHVQADIESFIVGGKYAKIQKFPHSAFLQARCNESWICASAILNQRLLLTAAHCVIGCSIDEPRNKINALMGHAILNKVSIKRQVMDVKIHKGYNEKSLANDIALALVAEDIPFGNNVKRVAIPRKFPRKIKGRRGYVAGWGVIDESNGESSIYLKYTSLNLRARRKCSVIGKMHKGMFCAGSLDNDTDHPAQGDSGGALVTRGYLQIGIVSFCLMRFPALSVYTNVTYYYNWISRHAKILYCKNNGWRK